jgi:hypothetical protein
MKVWEKYLYKEISRSTSLVYLQSRASYEERGRNSGTKREGTVDFYEFFAFCASFYENKSVYH